MSLFTDASMVLVPSAIKNQKIYSVKPTDGSGDLTFSRASSATRVNSSGLVEKVRENLLTYSNDFSNAAWTKVGTASITATGVTDPNGGTTAVTVSFPAAADQIYQSAGTQNNPFTNSIYVKGTAGETIAIWGFSGAGGYQLKTLTGSWQRISNTNNLSATAGFMAFGRNNTAATATSVSVAFAQAEASDIATDYIATTSSAVSVGPVSGLPRLDYSGGASCPSALLEPQRTNALTFSESFDNAAWNKVNITITANATTSPDGYQNADLLYPSSTGVNRECYKAYAYSSGLNYSYSVYAKADGLNWVFIGTDYAGGGKGAWFNLSTGVVGTQTSGYTATIENAGNGYYRCIVSYNQSVASNYYTVILTDADNSFSVTKNDTDGILIWGAQLEQGSYATSYIGPTYSAAVTRAAERAPKTGISSLIGQTEGTIYTEVNFSKLTGTVPREWFIISDADTSATSDWVTVSTSGAGTNLLRARIAQAGVIKYDKQYTLPAAGVYKMAFAYKSGDCELYVNGSAVGTVVTNSAFTLSMDRIITSFTSAAFELGDGLNQALVFKTRLSNADLATLTA